jgi:hypothetical protein
MWFLNDTTIIFVFYHFLTDRTVYSALNNHVIIVLLFSNAIQTLTDVPVDLAYCYTGIIWPPNVHYCIFSSFICNSITYTLNV